MEKLSELLTSLVGAGVNGILYIRRHKRGIASRWTLPVTILYLEIVLKASTIGDFFPSIIYLALFSCCFGWVLYLLASISKNPKVNMGIKTAMLSLLAAVFAIEYFVYHTFGIFYDLPTVLAGTGDALGGFGGQIVSMLLSPSGLFHIFLFVLPIPVYRHGIQRRLDQGKPVRAYVRIKLALQIVLVHLLAVLLIAIPGNVRNVYWSGYSFGSSVTDFGLMTSLRKEIQHQITGSNKKVSFQIEEPSVSEEPQEDSSSLDVAASVSEERIVYGKSVMDIDFDALAEGATETELEMDAYVQALTPSSQNEYTGLFTGKNLIFITAEALSAEAIREDTTPTLYRMATKGINFTDYYQPSYAGTTGGEFYNIMGIAPSDGGESMVDAADNNNYFTMGNVLNRLGYNGWAFHNNDYTYYDRHITHIALGYNNGYMGFGNGMEEYVASQWPESDLEMIQGTFEDIYGDAAPFNIYYMSVSGHSTYTRDTNAMADKNWSKVENLDYSEEVKAYLAAQSELDNAMEYLISALEEKGIADDTVIVLAADHYPYGLDTGEGYISELYGYEPETDLQRDHNRLIIWSECLEDEDPIIVDTPTFSLDILPTLLNLFGCEWDSRLLPGRDVFSDAMPLVFNQAYDWKTTEGEYDFSTGVFIPAEGKTVSESYIEKINAIVSNKINYSAGVLMNDYFAHLFGPAEDVQEVNTRGKAENADLIAKAQAAYTYQTSASAASASPVASAAASPAS